VEKEAFRTIAERESATSPAMRGGEKTLPLGRKGEVATTIAEGALVTFTEEKRRGRKKGGRQRFW